MFTDEYFSIRVFARTGGGEGAQPNAESCRQGKEGSKITKNVRHPLWIALYILSIKIGPSKSKFSDLPLLALKFTKFLMSFFEPRVSFSSNFESLFSVMRHNSSLVFYLNLYMLSTKGAYQSANFQTFNCSHES